MGDRKKVGLSRRELEWAVQGMLRQAPADPAGLARHLAELVMTLIEKNNAAIARAIEGREGQHDDEERRS